MFHHKWTVFTFVSESLMLCVGVFARLTIVMLDSLQRRLQPFAIMYLMIYTLGYPAFVAWLLYRHRLLIMEDQLLVAKGASACFVMKQTSPCGQTFISLLKF